MLPKFNRRSFLCSAIVFALLGCAGCAEVSPQVVFRGQTKDEASSYVIYLIKRLPWYEERGYKIVLPEHEAFKNFYEKPVDVSYADENYLKKIFAAEIYDEFVFDRHLEEVCKTEDTILKALQKLVALEKNWGFKLFSTSEVVLTLYGPGGRYRPNMGKIILLASPDKIFEKEDLEKIIIHEIVHIGIEKNIVKRYKLTHWQKERVVDLICLLYLNDVVPYYKPNHLNEKNGDRRIDEFVDKEAIIQDLPSAIEKFKAHFP